MILHDRYRVISGAYFAKSSQTRSRVERNPERISSHSIGNLVPDNMRKRPGMAIHANATFASAKTGNMQNKSMSF